MNGIDPGAIALNIITYFGGAGGAAMAGSAVLVTYILVALHVMHPKAGWMTTVAVMAAWISAWTVRTIIGWA